MDTLMKPGSRNAIEDYNQIEKYKAENNYRIFLQSQAQEGYDAATSSHSDFKIRVAPNGTEHIKKAKIRVTFAAIPTNVGTRDGSSAFYFVGLGISKNVYGPRLGAGASEIYNPGAISRTVIITAFHAVPLTSVANGTDVVPAVSTAVGVAEADGSLSVGDNTNTGSVFNTQSEAQEAMEHPAAIPNVTQAQHNLTSVEYTQMGMMGKSFDTGFVLCDNPFGKTLQVKLLDHTGVNQGFGNAADETTCIGLEVQLLPDNQSNDKFTY